MSFLIILPPAITVAEALVVPDTSTADADVVDPANDAPNVVFNVKPAVTVAKPDIATCGVKVTFDNIATLTAPL